MKLRVQRKYVRPQDITFLYVLAYNHSVKEVITLCKVMRDTAMNLFHILLTYSVTVEFVSE